MDVLVVDASALAKYLLRTENGPRVERVITRPQVDLHVPALCDVEVVAVLRRGLLRERLEPQRARQALWDLLDLPLMRHGHQADIGRGLELHRDFSAYDAVYVALAERLGARLVTTDARLARAVREHLALEVERPRAG